MRLARYFVATLVRMLFAAVALSFMARYHASAAEVSTDPTLQVTLTHTNQQIVLSWVGANAVPYQVETSTNLTAWSSLGSSLTGSGALLSVTNSSAGQSRRFFRVVRLFPAPQNSAVFNPATGLLTIVGDNNDNVITVSRNGDLILVNGGAIPITGGTAAVTNTVLIQVLGLGGDDKITMGNSLPVAHLFGGTGNDTLIGGSAAEILVGGPGNDFIDGNLGNDLIFGGDGDDTIQWDPGDGSDTIEGQGGNDVLIFNGANVNENIDLSANGSRLRFFRDVANITLDVNGVERVDFRALGGADNIVINSLAGTGVSLVNVDLAPTGGGTDGAPDTVTINGTPGADIITVSNNAGTMVVSGLAAQIQVVNGSVTNDSIVINGIGGDLVNVNGSNGADSMTIVPNGVYARVDASGFTTPVNVAGALRLSVNGLGGPDVISGANGLAGLNIPLTIDGGDGDDILSGGDGDDVIIGGIGNDFIDGNRGNDTILAGEGDDTIQWDPGDGSDTIEGQGGNDTLIFNGANVNEKIDLSANGGRLRFFRDVANITMDVNGVERVNFRALGGADNIVVNNLAGTDVAVVSVDLAATGGGTDGAPDTITINGTPGADIITVSNNAGTMVVSGLAAQIQVVNGSVTNDSIVINGIGGDLVNVNGSNGADSMTIVPNGVYARVDASGFTTPVNVTGALRLSVNGLGGPDVIGGANGLAALNIPLTIDGGDGDDILNGGDGNDVIIGGIGNDFIDGNRGNDTILAGEGDDTIQWDPGDGSDTIEGQGGIDTLVFNGANVNENIDLSANGSRLRFFRDVANITMDVNGVERVDFHALGGADNIVVNSLAGTDVTLVSIFLAATIGGGDAAADTVTMNGTASPDAFSVINNAGVIETSGLAAKVRILTPEVANDRLVLNGLGGTDTFSIGAGVTSLITVITNQ
jgi:Ca2+-binding RTX toxin-like protein